MSETHAHNTDTVQEPYLAEAPIESEKGKSTDLYESCFSCQSSWKQHHHQAFSFQSFQVPSKFEVPAFVTDMPSD